MEKFKFYFKIRGSADGKTNVLCITSIETLIKTKFIFSDNLQLASLHTIITSLDAFAKIRKSVTKRNQLRKIWILASEQIREVSLDGEENLRYNNYFLEELKINNAEAPETMQMSLLER